MSLLRWLGQHRLLTMLLAGLVLVWAAGSGSADDPGQESGPSRGAQHDTHPGAAAPGGNDHGDHTGSGRERHRRGTPTERAGGARQQPAPPAPRTYVVTRVVDGDTLELGNGETVRLVGIDTPEVGECGYEEASARLASLTLGRQVTLARSDEDRDRYGRLLRYVDVGDLDAGLRLIRTGFAIARYDSRDGYGYHPREPAYIAADRARRSAGCARPRPLASHAASGGCAPGYAPCVPSYPPDVDCADVQGPVQVTGSDPHALDGDGDGTACE